MKTLKFKLTSVVMAFIIVVSLLIVAVVAVPNINLSINGNVSFVVNETDVYLNKVTLKNTVTETSEGNYQAGDKVLDSYSDLYIQENTSIDISDVTVLSNQTMEIDFDMTSLNANYIKVNLSYQNLPSTVHIASTSLYMPKNPSEDLLQGDTRTYKIYIKNTGTSALNLSNINLQISFEEKTSLLQNDTTNQYYYVEMGTIATSTGSEYIKWRYISADGENAYTYNSTTAPTGTGYFILETNVLDAVGLDGTNNMIEVPFNADYIQNDVEADIENHHMQNGWENIAANDYSTSNVRQYINGNNVYDDRTLANNIFTPSGRYSNMYADYNIDPENDLVYQNIIGRSLGDLYKGMGWDGSKFPPTYFDTTFPIFNESATVKYTENDVDKFWLLSYKEAYNLFPTMSDSLWMDIYWLRSPYSHAGKGVWGCYVDSSGDLSYTNVVLSHVAARAAFKFSI